MKYTYDEIETIDKVFAIAHAFTECRHWIEMEETDNYLKGIDSNQKNLLFCRLFVGFLSSEVTDIISIKKASLGNSLV